MKLFKLLTVLILLIFGITASASALSIVNGSFETGDFTGWTQTSDGLGGYSTVTTSHAAFDGTIYSATDGQYFANLSATSFIAQGQTWGAGYQLTFDWAFCADDYLPFNDFSVFKVLDTGGSVIDNITLSDVAGIGDYGDTGWNEYTYTFAAAGAGSLQFGSVNGVDGIMDSNLLLDNVAAPVPEPASIFLMGVGLLGLVSNRKRFIKKS